MKRTLFRTCSLCEAMCGLAFEVEDNRVLSVRPDPENVFSRGYACPKGIAMLEIHDDPDRLRRPIRKTAGGWKEIDWDEALDLAAGRLTEIQEKHGPNSIGVYYGNPSVHQLGLLLFLRGFHQALGTVNRFHANSQDADPKLRANDLLYGHPSVVPIPDVDRTDFFLILGANPVVSNGSLLTAPNMRRRLQNIRARGGRVVVIDPRRTETAKAADQHYFIRPGGDAYLVAAMLHVLFEEGRVDRGSIRRWTGGTDRLQSAVRRFPPERVADRTGIPADRIRQLAIDFASAPSAVCYGGVGTCLNAYGTTASGLIDALNVVTGNCDRPGGMMFSDPVLSLTTGSSGEQKQRYGRWRSRVRGVPEFDGALPASVIAEEIETPGEGQIRGFVTIAGNPVLTIANGGRLSRALGGLEFMVSIDIYLNETTRSADLILPPAWALERSDYDIVFHSFSVRNWATYSERIVEPAPDTRDDWQIVSALSERLGGTPTGNAMADQLIRSRREAGSETTPEDLLEVLLAMGPQSGSVTLERLKANPHGIDLGPLRPVLEQRIRTADRRIQLEPEVLIGDFDRMDRDLEATGGGALLLIGRRQIRTNNSWMHNAPLLMRGKDRCTLLMHPEDAAALSLTDGQTVTIRSRVGAVTAPVEVSEDVMPGIVSLPHGYGHRFDDMRLSVAREHAGASVNDLTDDELLDPLVGTAVLNGVPVTVDRGQRTVVSCITS